MAITSAISSGPYTGNGSQTAFPFSFTAMSSADVVVLVDGAAVSSALYSVSINSDGNSGTVTFGTAPAVGAEVLIEQLPDFVQDSQFLNEAAYSLASVNAINRRQTMRANWLKSEHEDLAARTLRVPEGEVIAALPAEADRASKLLGFDGDGNPLPVAEGDEPGLLRAELDASGGGALIGLAQGGKVQDAISWVTPEIFGAIGDGNSHPLSERYASLAAAQAVYPFATSLTQQIDYCAIVAAINSATYTSHGIWYHSGPEIRLKDGAVYRMGADTLQLKKSVRIRGAGSGMPWTSMAALKWDAGATGIIVHRYNTIGATVEGSPTTAADGTVLEGFRMLGAVGTADSLGGHGIWLRARAVCRDLYIQDFRGNGYHVVAAAISGSPIEGNANCFQIYGGRVQGCENGFYADGPDANAGIIEATDFSNNRRWGVWDSSFLGNTFIAIHCDDNGNGQAVDGQSAFASYGGNSYQAVPTATAGQLVSTTPGTNENIWKPILSVGIRAIAWTGSNPSGTYRHGGPVYTEHASGPVNLLGTYIESGHGVGFLSPVTTMLGGIWEMPVGGAALRGSNNNFDTTSGYRSAASSAGKTVTAQLGGNAANGDILYWQHSDDTFGSPWRMHRAGADWVVDNANAGSRIAFLLTGELTGQFMGTSQTQPYLFNAPVLAIGSGGDARRQTTGSAAPTTGAWAKGDIVWNTGAAASGKIGWVCVTAGTPGTWKTFGAIDA